MRSGWGPRIGAAAPPGVTVGSSGSMGPICRWGTDWQGRRPLRLHHGALPATASHLLRPSAIGLALPQIPMDHGDRHAPLTHGGGASLDGGVTNVAGREDAGHAGLEQVWIALRRPIDRRTLTQQVQ